MRKRRVPISQAMKARILEQMRDPSISYHALADKYGVSYDTIRAIASVAKMRRPERYYYGIDDPAAVCVEVNRALDALTRRQAQVKRYMKTSVGFAMAIHKLYGCAWTHYEDGKPVVLVPCAA